MSRSPLHTVVTESEGKCLPLSFLFTAMIFRCGSQLHLEWPIVKQPRRGGICKQRPALPLGLRSGSGTKKTTRRGDGIVTSQLQQMPGRPEQTLSLHASTPSFFFIFFLFCTQSSPCPVPVRCTHKAGFHPSTAQGVLIHTTRPEPFPSEAPSTCTGLVYAAWVSSPTPPKCPGHGSEKPARLTQSRRRSCGGT